MYIYLDKSAENSMVRVYSKSNGQGGSIDVTHTDHIASEQSDFPLLVQELLSLETSDQSCSFQLHGLTGQYTESTLIIKAPISVERPAEQPDRLIDIYVDDYTDLGKYRISTASLAEITNFLNNM